MVDDNKAEEAVRLMLEAIGEDPAREGLSETPQRVARMFHELFEGSDEAAAGHLSKTFTVSGSELVLEKDIQFYSMCEHHILPFFGSVHIAYVPDGKVVGLSKLARTVDEYARRLQLQERFTAQIADAVMEALEPKGVLVISEAEHMCMTMRGVKKPGTKTMVYATRGVFNDNAELVSRVFSMVKD